MTRSIGRLVVGAVLLVVGIGWLLHTSGLLVFPLRALVAVALIIVGLGLVIGSTTGSHPGLILLGLFIAIALVIGSARGFVTVRDEPAAGFGDRVFAPTSPDQIRPYRIDAGQLTIDLRNLRIDRPSPRIEASVGAGRIRVIVPPDVPLFVSARTGVGSVDVLGQRLASGISVEDSYMSPDYDVQAVRLELQLTASVGSIEVVSGRTRAPRGTTRRQGPSHEQRIDIHIDRGVRR